MNQKRRTWAAILMALAMSVFMVAPALAQHKDGHDGGAAATSDQDAKKGGGKDRDGKGDRDGDADSDPDTQYTEDNDTNDDAANNEADDDDNLHPSGKDRSVENGKSGNQGKSESDPDDDGRGPDRTNGGPDKPNGSGGVDKEDQDGNNGCGNDDDFEDDNEGWCRGGKSKDKPSKPGKGDDEVKGDDDDVEGDVVCPEGTGPMPGNSKHCKPDDVDADDVPQPCEDDATMPSGGESCTPEEKEEKDNEKISICHATGSATNPFVAITISVNGLNGHRDHEGDIIPMPEGGCPVPGGTTLPPTVGEDDSVGGETVEQCPEDSTMTAAGDCFKPEVRGITVVQDDAKAAGEEQERGISVLGAVLPFTGGDVVRFLVIAAALILVGMFAMRLRREH